MRLVFGLAIIALLSQPLVWAGETCAPPPGEGWVWARLGRSLARLAGPSPIDTSLRQAYGNSALTEQSYLEGFSTDLLGTTGFAELGNHVFLVQDSNGRRYVVRVSGEREHNIPRESFAIGFVRRIPGLRKPLTRRLSAPEREAFLRLYRAALPDEAEGSISYWAERGFGPERMEISVAPYVPGSIGGEALSRAAISDPLIKALSRIARGGYSAFDFRHYSRIVRDELASYPPDRRDQLVSDLRTYVPSLSGLTPDQMFQRILREPTVLEGTRIATLSRIRIEAQAPELLEDLANAWIANMILGIPDFHPNNWMLVDDQVVTLDLALSRPTRAPRGRPALELPERQSPLDSSPPYPGDVFEVLPWRVHQRVKRYLRSLTPERIRQIAREARYPIRAAEVQAIMSRIEAYLGNYP